MARIIDLRNQGGELVLLGKALVLPAADDTANDGIKPLVGSVRYNPTADGVEIYLPAKSGSEWVPVLLSRGTEDFLFKSENAEFETVNVTRKLTADSALIETGVVSTLSSFNLSVTHDFNLPYEPPAEIILSTANTDWVIKHDATHELVLEYQGQGAFAFNSDGTFSSKIGRFDGLRVANTGFVRDLTSYRLQILPTDTDPIDAPAVLNLTTNTTTWSISHDAEHTLSFRYEGERTFFVRTDGTIQYRDGEFEHLTVGNVAQVANLYANTVSTPSLSIVPDAHGQFEQIAQVVLETNSTTWSMAHEASHLLSLRYQGTTLSTFESSGRFTTLSGQFNDVAVSNAVQVATLRANTGNIDQLTTTNFSILADPNAPVDQSSQVTLSSNGVAWAMTHESSHRLSLRYDGNLVLSVDNAGTVQAPKASLASATVSNLAATAGYVRSLSANQLSVVPDTGSDPAATSQMVLTTAGTDWALTHEAQHLLTMRYNGLKAFSFDANGVVEGQRFTGAAASVSSADVAERYHADATYEPGTVLILGGDHEVTISERFGDTRLAGVVSTAPGVMLNQDAGTDATHPYIALKGRVPCKVVGPIHKGDLLVTSSVPGHAQASAAVREGCLVGKALEDFAGSETGVIEIMVC